MPRYLDPDVGEVLDRLGILELKLEAGMRRGISTQAWEDERAELERFLQKKLEAWQKQVDSFKMEEFNRLNASLVNANTKIWFAEDELRELRKADPEPKGEAAEKVAEVALRIADLNDARGDCVQKINGLFGVQTREKIYNVL